MNSKVVTCHIASVDTNMNILHQCCNNIFASDELFARFARPSVFDIFYGLSLKKKSSLGFFRVQFGSKLGVLKGFREVDYASIFLLHFQLYIALILKFIRSQRALEVNLIFGFVCHNNAYQLFFMIYLSYNSSPFPVLSL